MSIPLDFAHEHVASYFLAQFGGISICGESLQSLGFFPAIRLPHAHAFQKLVRIQSTHDADRDAAA
jgi:hypothetical protein